ncbi:hypothetical protein N7449_002794 [Penicillium cf. viridicatum]|uniref:Uncharacterized protein n=1 Tax=Penicillium cf. viridicatum TaxID=2972119 RepID=A0A9W9T4M5_9EURO|nr:hypothetical protein N7449_002794 [Penicillium cf. viridicatum]
MTIKASVESGGWSVDKNWSSFVNPALKHILVAAGWFKRNTVHSTDSIWPSVETKAQIHAASPVSRRFLRPQSAIIHTSNGRKSNHDKGIADRLPMLSMAAPITGVVRTRQTSP